MAIDEDLRRVERSVEEALTHAGVYLKAELEQEMPDSRVAAWWVEVHSSSTMLLMALHKLKSYYTAYSKIADSKLNNHNKPAGGVK